MHELLQSVRGERDFLILQLEDKRSEMERYFTSPLFSLVQQFKLLPYSLAYEVKERNVVELVGSLWILGYEWSELISVHCLVYIYWILGRFYRHCVCLGFRCSTQSVCWPRGWNSCSISSAVMSIGHQKGSHPGQGLASHFVFHLHWLSFQRDNSLIRCHSLFSCICLHISKR